MIRSNDAPGGQDNSRIDELESRLALQDQSLLELSNEVYRQQQQIMRLESQLRALTERIQALGAREAPPAPADELPPHY